MLISYPLEDVCTLLLLPDDGPQNVPSSRPPAIRVSPLSLPVEPSTRTLLLFMFYYTSLFLLLLFLTTRVSFFPTGYHPSIFKPGTSSKCLTLRVKISALCSNAIPAINESFNPIGLPIFFKVLRI